jgi:hypothetical protein
LCQKPTYQDGILPVCTKEEQRTLAGFLWAKAIKVAEIHKQMSVQYGDSGKLD